MAFLAKREFWLAFAGLAVTVGMAVAVVFYWEYIRALGNYGYAGAFFISLLAGATYVAPVPATPVIFALGAVLRPSFAPYLGPVFIGLAAGAGETIGGVTTYLTGYGGGTILDKIKTGALKGVYLRLLHWMERRGSWVIFILSITLNPLFYPAAITAGATHYNLRKFIFLSLIGKIIKSTMVAAVGYWGLGSILRALGIPI